MTDNYQEKSDQKMRVFDDDGYRQRAACICVRNENEDQILLITSHRDPTSWIIPGGGVEPNENVCDAAHRELYEEAGVKGRIGRQLGVFENNERKHRTTVFVVYCEEEYEDWEDKRLVNRQRRWYSLNETIQMIRRSKASQLPFLQTFLQTSPHQAKFHHQLSLTQH